MQETALSTADLFKKSILEGFDLARQNLTVANVLMTMVFAFGLGVFIYFIYRRAFKGVLYSHSFNVSLIMLTMVTTLVILVISHSLALSLGMVGALSIVRFRTAVKDPQDTVYMFWALVEGIALGAGYYLLAIIGALVIGAALIGVSLISGTIGESFLLVIHYADGGDQDVAATLRRVAKKKLKSKTVTRNGVEMTLEVRLPGGRASVVDELLNTPGVYDATLVSYKGDMA